MRTSVPQPSPPQVLNTALLSATQPNPVTQPVPAPVTLGHLSSRATVEHQPATPTAPVVLRTSATGSQRQPSASAATGTERKQRQRQHQKEANVLSGAAGRAGVSVSDFETMPRDTQQRYINEEKEYMSEQKKLQALKRKYEDVPAFWQMEPDEFFALPPDEQAQKHTDMRKAKNKRHNAKRYGQ